MVYFECMEGNILNEQHITTNYKRSKKRTCRIGVKLTVLHLAIRVPRHGCSAHGDEQRSPIFLFTVFGRYVQVHVHVHVGPVSISFIFA